MPEHIPITVAYGDGIGPEIMHAVLHILREADAPLSIQTIEIGKEMYEKGCPTGIPDSAWRTIRQNKVLLKAPITTPQGGGYKSLNVTLRRALGLYANIRPCVAYTPFVKTHFPNLNMVIVRENEEDLYSGMEYRLTQNVYEALKLTSRRGCERIINYAFDYAIRNGRKKVTCFTKDNIMKMTDGLFHQVFDEIAARHKDIKAEHMIIDIATAKIAANPEAFDVVVTSNLYGDIVSDVAAEISGSVGMAGSANIGHEYAMFEAIHGSAPDIAGEDMANPSGLLHAAIMMLVHIGQPKIAGYIHNAWLATIENGIHTADIYHPDTSKQKVGTQDFAEAVCEYMYRKPEIFPVIEYLPKDEHEAPVTLHTSPHKLEEKKLVGIDVFIEHTPDSVNALAELINDAITNQPLKLQFIDARGLKVWPDMGYYVALGDFWRLRFLPEGEKQTTQHELIALQQCLTEKGISIVKTEHLALYDGKLGFTAVQGG
jgi:isocitrate dehydrogenase